MCNNIAVASHTQPGDAILAARDSHILRSESAGAVMLGRVQTESIDSRDGRFSPDALHRHARAGSLYEPPTTLLCLEQTHNFAGGTVWPLSDLVAVSRAAREHGMAIHLDGARLFNAAVATGSPARSFAEPVDSVWICFTKGLGAPIGAVLTGSAAFIERARRLKHISGGALRQAGIAAAGCLYALEHHVHRLAEDHANAQRLAAGLAQLSMLQVHNPTPDTNMVFFELATERWTNDEFLARLVQAGVRIGPVGAQLRAVTHLDVTSADIDDALVRIAHVLEQDTSSRPTPRASRPTTPI